MKSLMLTLGLLLSTAAVHADGFGYVRADKQFRYLTNTLNFYPQTVLNVSGTNAAFAIAPVSGQVTKLTCVNQAALTGTTATISPSIGTVYMGTATATVTSVTAVGGVVSATIATSNTVTAGQALRVHSSTGITAGGTVNCMFTIDPTVTY